MQWLRGGRHSYRSPHSASPALGRPRGRLPGRARCAPHVLVGQATLAPDGKIIAPPGTVEAFQKYLQLAPDGKSAQSAKEMLAQLGGTIDTTYKGPAATKKKK